MFGTYHTCPAGLLGVPQTGRGIEDQEVQEFEGVPLNSAYVLHFAAWNTPANKDKRQMFYLFQEMTRFGLFYSGVLCKRDRERQLCTRFGELLVEYGYTCPG